MGQFVYSALYSTHFKNSLCFDEKRWASKCDNLFYIYLCRHRVLFKLLAYSLKRHHCYVRHSHMPLYPVTCTDKPITIEEQYHLLPYQYNSYNKQNLM